MRKFSQKYKDPVKQAEYAYSLIDSMTEEQLKGFILLFGGLAGSSEVPNEETYEAISEVEDMKLHIE